MGSAWFWRVTRVADLLLRLRGLGSGRQVPRPLHLLQRDHLCGVQVTCRLLQEEGGSVVVRFCGEPARQTRQKHSDPYEVLKDRSHDVEPGEGSAGVSIVVETARHWSDRAHDAGRGGRAESHTHFSSDHGSFLNSGGKSDLSTSSFRFVWDVPENEWRKERERERERENGGWSAASLVGGRLV